MPTPKLLDQVRNILRVKHLSLSTERAYVGWVRRYILFHNKKHPTEMAEPEIRQFMSHLAVDAKISTSTQLGHKDVRTTMVYTHVLNRGRRGVKSPLD